MDSRTTAVATRWLRLRFVARAPDVDAEVSGRPVVVAPPSADAAAVEVAEILLVGISPSADATPPSSELARAQTYQTIQDNFCLLQDHMNLPVSCHSQRLGDREC